MDVPNSQLDASVSKPCSTMANPKPHSSSGNPNPTSMKLSECRRQQVQVYKTKPQQQDQVTVSTPGRKHPKTDLSFSDPWVRGKGIRLTNII